MTTGTDNYYFVVVGCGAAGLSTAVSYIEAPTQQGRTPRVAVQESAPENSR